MKSTYDSDYRRLLALLVEARNKAGMTQQDLAKALGRPQSFVSKVEHGERRIDVVEFMGFCRALGANPTRLIKQIER